MKAYCDLPFDRLKIDEDGSYQSCCHQTEYYGNLLTDGLKIEEITKHHKIVDVKNAVLTNDLHTSCNNIQCPFFYTDRKKTKEVRLSKYPKQIELNLSSKLCNIGGENPTPKTACIMCPRSSEEFMNSVPKDRTDELLEIVKPAIPHLNTFTILGIAEPFWRGKLFEVLDKVQWNDLEKKPFFWTFSNGTVFHDSIQDIYMNEYIDRGCIGFSVDSASPETYKMIRRINGFNNLTKNLETYFNKTHKETIKRDWSFMTFNINMLNLHEMSKMVYLAHNLGANRIQFNLTYISNGGMALPLKMLCNEKNWQYFWEGQQRAQQIADKLDFEIEFYVPFHKGYLK